MVQAGKSIRNPRAPLVVKLGGSLHHRIPEIVPLLCGSGRPLLVVSGGGLFADAVRQEQVADDAAHWMAVAAMEQYAWVIASHGMRTTDILAVPETTAVFLPYISMRQRDPLPHSWDVTSDSIAAWIAAELGIELLVLKSVDGIILKGIIQEQVTIPIKNDVVDPFFIPFVLKHRIKTTIINGKSGVGIEKFLNCEPVLCTKIGTTF
ncbi:MAG: uridylate kinase [Methanoregula sp.]|nr:uridylate kinase [Methanoregula sp.]